MLLSDELRAYMHIINFLACTKVELQDLTFCIAVNGEIFSIAYYNEFKFHVPLINIIF